MLHCCAVLRRFPLKLLMPGSCRYCSWRDVDTFSVDIIFSGCYGFSQSLLLIILSTTDIPCMLISLDCISAVLDVYVWHSTCLA